VIYVVRYALISVCTVIWGVIGMAVAPFSGEAVVWVARNWLGWVAAVCGVDVRSEGLEQIPEGPAVYMSNHQSVFDILAVVLTLPRSWRFVYKRELVWIPFFGWAIGLSDQVQVDRRSRTRSVASLHEAAMRVKGGISVIIFPEGTRSPDGELQPFKSGGFHLALDAGVPIVPVTVSGSRRLTPQRSLKVESGPVRVFYGAPIATEGLDASHRNALKERVREAIELGFDRELQDAVPADELAGAPAVSGDRPTA
jgi:1-acyl-sn-glycerol-3-phosphate acyltransferase